MTFKYVHVRTHESGSKRWICVDRVRSTREAEKTIAVCRERDSKWASAEYLIGDTLYPDAGLEGVGYQS